MEQRKYSIRDVQRISRLSPATLQDLMRKNSACFTLEVVKLPTGEEEVYLDQPSFERLMFLKRLQLHEAGTEEETLEQLRGTALNFQNDEGAESFSLDSSLDAIALEMRELKSSFTDVLLKYKELNRELNHARVENARLSTENAALKTRQQNLLNGLNPQIIDEEPPPEPDNVN